MISQSCNLWCRMISSEWLTTDHMVLKEFTKNSLLPYKGPGSGRITGPCFVYSHDPGIDEILKTPRARSTKQLPGY